MNKPEAKWWDKLGEPQYGGEITIRANKDIVNFDPYFSEGLTSIFGGWMERLVCDDWTVGPDEWDFRTAWHPAKYLRGQLAESWEFPEPGTHVVHLRKGVRWQNLPPANGREFTADDVVFHYNRLYGLGGEFRYASDLVEFIRAETGDHFHIEVAAYPEMHPQAKSPDADLQAFASKVKAGANSGITQYFFNPDAYFRYVDDLLKLGVEVPIVPGIMPITNSSQLLRFSDACGAEVPRWIRLRLQSFGDDVESIKAFGLDVIVDLCEQLRAGGAPGLHLYTMNQSVASTAIVSALFKD